MSEDEHLGLEQKAEPKTIVIDYGGANVAKPLHVGHLRTAIMEKALNVLHVLWEIKLSEMCI